MGQSRQGNNRQERASQEVREGVWRGQHRAPASISFSVLREVQWRFVSTFSKAYREEQQRDQGLSDRRQCKLPPHAHGQRLGRGQLRSDRTLLLTVVLAGFESC